MNISIEIEEEVLLHIMNILAQRPYAEVVSILADLERQRMAAKETLNNAS